MLPADFNLPAMAGVVLFPWGRWSAPATMARDLYSALRALDAQGCTVVLCPVPPDQGIGVAICDRLRKAARKA
jgi:L-threonylcarbamoyladenylate synthase